MVVMTTPATLTPPVSGAGSELSGVSFLCSAAVTAAIGDVFLCGDAVAKPDALAAFMGVGTGRRRIRNSDFWKLGMRITLVTKQNTLLRVTRFGLLMHWQFI